MWKIAINVNSHYIKCLAEFLVHHEHLVNGEWAPSEEEVWQRDTPQVRLPRRCVLTWFRHPGLKGDPGPAAFLVCHGLAPSQPSNPVFSAGRCERGRGLGLRMSLMTPCRGFFRGSNMASVIYEVSSPLTISAVVPSLQPRQVPLRFPPIISNVCF